MSNLAVVVGVIAGVLSAFVFHIGTAEDPLRISLVDRECEDAQRQYYLARERATVPNDEKSSEPDKKRDEAHDHADVCAQHRMAQAAEWGFWLLLGTLMFTAIAALAASRTVLVMKDTAERQLRAYLNLEAAHLMVGTESAHAQELTLDVTFKNFGNTPAHEVQLIYELTLRGNREAQTARSYGSIGPTSKISVRETFRFPAADDDVGWMTIGSPRVQIWAWISYRAVHDPPGDKRRETLTHLTNGHAFYDEHGAASRRLLGFHMVPEGPDNRST